MSEPQADVQAMLDVLPEPALLHERGKILIANAAFATLLEFDTTADLIGHDALEFVHPDDRDFVSGRIASAARNRRTPEHRLMSRTGKVVPVEVTGVPFPFAGRVVALATIYDLRERKRHEAALAAAQRMVTLGRTASALGHELNNPLTYLVLSLELLLRDISRLAGEPVAKQLGSRVRDALDGANRVRDIVRDLKTATAADDTPIGPVDLRRVLDVAIATTAHEIEHRARLVRDIPDVPPVCGNELRLTQVFVNLLVNAAQAIPDGDVASNEIRVTARFDGQHVLVDVIDSGCGLGAVDIAQIFEPFYTTKRGIGTGLGLSIAHRLVSSCGGTITAEARLPRGACFRVALSTAGASTAASIAPTGTPQPARVARVLFVDDEDMIRKLAAEIVAPHDVVSVPSGRAAIALLESGEPIDVVLCDFQMPDLGGVDVYDWIVKHRPEMATRIAFMTGGAFTERAEQFLTTTSRPYLDKPLNLERVREVIARLLA